VQKITTHVWYDTEAKEAAEFYTSTFRDSKVKHATTLHNTPSGSVDVVTMELWGRHFTLISAGPLFKFNPSISFHAACKTKDEVEMLWKKLSAGGSVLMELGTYPFSVRYGCVQDRYGLSWQLIYVGESVKKHKITPVLMFVGDVCGKAEKAVNFYTSVFHDARIDKILRYGKGEEPNREGTLKYASFTLENEEFGATDSAHEHHFKFNEAISFMVHCDTQEEIDYFWEKLSAVPEAEQCGWLKDEFGLSWQIVPSILAPMLMSKDEKQAARVTEAFLKMKKFDLRGLQRAYDGK
jgi:predicted 3-demethylubiquinone-9 3-methyltransferase (glyoxalase superfamily)